MVHSVPRVPPVIDNESDALLGGRYRIVRQLGEGGMGTVHEAIQEGLGRRVAVKLLHPSRVASDRQRARFRREAETIAQLLHPNLVQVTDFGIDGHRPFMVMEYLEGESLRSYLERDGPLEPGRAVEIVAAVLAALRTVHAAGVVHRDIKPGNIFLVWDDDGRPIPKLLDFGIASDRDQADSEPDSDDAEPAPAEVPRSSDRERLTRTDSVFGTVAYMAPEQVRSAKLAGPAADQYAVGVVLYECLSGRLPHEGDSAAMLSVAKLKHAPPDIRELCDGLSAELGDVVMRVLSFEPGARFEDVSALRAALVGERVSVPVARGPASDAETLETRSTAPSETTADTASALTITTADLGARSVLPPREEATAVPVSRRGWGWILAGVVLFGGLAVGIAAMDWSTGSGAPASVSRPGEKGREVVALKGRPILEDVVTEEVLTGPSSDPSPRPRPGEGTRLPPPPAEPPAAEPSALPTPPPDRSAVRAADPSSTASAAPARPPARGLRRRAMRVDGYDSWTAAVHLDAAEPRLRACLARNEQAGAPLASGSAAALRLRVDDLGTARDCRISEVPAWFQTCACAALRALNWSTPPGGDATVSASYLLE